MTSKPLFLPSAQRQAVTPETPVERPVTGSALDEGVDFFKVQGALAAERLAE